MPPSSSPDDGPREGWQRRPRSVVRRPREPEESPDHGRGGSQTDPYGWSGVRDQGGYPPPEGYGRPRGDQPPYEPNARPPFEPPADLPGRPPFDPPADVPGRPPYEPNGREPFESNGRGPGEPPPAARSGRPRLRRPHKRRAVAGQQTGLDPDLQSDLPSWLEERGVALAPARRLLSLSVALFAALLGFGLLLGAHALPGSYGFVIFAVQLFFVLAWTVAMRPPGSWVVAAVGVAAAAGADLAAVLPKDASLAPLGYVTVAGFVFGVIGQLLRGTGRQGVTESLGATLAVVVGVVAFASLLVLDRHPLGTQSIVVCLSAAAVGLVVARLTDVVLPAPRTSPEVPRGAIGVVLGAMAGTATAGAIGSVLAGLQSHPGRAAVAGLVTVVAAIMADLAVSYAEVGRELGGEDSSLWIARHMQGPLGGFALAAPAAYILSVMVLVPGL